MVETNTPEGLNLKMTAFAPIRDKGFTEGTVRFRWAIYGILLENKTGNTISGALDSLVVGKANGLSVEVMDASGVTAMSQLTFNLSPGETYLATITMIPDDNQQPGSVPTNHGAVVFWLKEALACYHGLTGELVMGEEPLMNIYAERFVKSIKYECIQKLILVGEGSLRRAVNQYVIHYNEERNHQGIDNQLINPRPGTVIPVDDPQAVENQSEIEKGGRLGDMLNFYYKKAS